MMDTLILVIVCTISFAFGMYVERNLQRRSKPVERSEYDEHWAEPLKDTYFADCDVQRTVAHLYAPWKK